MLLHATVPTHSFQSGTYAAAQKCMMHNVYALWQGNDDLFEGLMIITS